MAAISIAGAGLSGRLLGYRLTSAGHDVTLYERASRDAPTSAAHVAAAMLAPISELPESEPRVVAMGTESLAAWPALLDELGVAYGMTGSIFVAHGTDARLLDKFVRSLRDHADQTSWLDATALANLEPELTGFQRGLFVEGEGWLDNRGLLDALESRCGTIRYDMEVDPGELSGDVVVDCRGAAADVPELRGVRGEVVRVRAPEVRLTRPIRLMHPRYQIYIVPRPGDEYVVGATQLENEDTSGVTVRSALELLSAAFAVTSGFAEAEILELAAAARPAFPDHQPRVEWLDGVLSLNGLYRHGFLVAPSVVTQAQQAIEGALCKSPSTANSSR